MFGKPEWFRLKQNGRGLTPVRWQGWLYATTWIGVICLPFVTLLMQHLALESFVWMGAALAALSWDVRQIGKSLRTVDDADVLYIGDDEPQQQLSTRNYEFRLRR